MTDTPNKEWVFVGNSANCAVYSIRPDLLAVIPEQDIRETADTARSNLEVQAKFWQKQGHGGAVIVFMDPILEQDAGARAVYANEAGTIGTKCFALIGESYFAMASASVYTGLARPSVALEVFRKFEDALPWIDQIIAKSETP